MKKFLAMFLVMLLAFSLVACGGGGETEGETEGFKLEPGDIIGVSLNSQGSERWQRDAATLQADIEAAGYECMMQFNENNAITQANQIQNMVLAGAKVIIVCPYDNGSLNSVLAEARAAGVVIINYDLAVVGTADVDYFVGYNNKEVGVMQAQALIEGLDLDNATPDNPKYIEMFAGALNEANCWYYFETAMETLKPYFDSGVLVCRSGETDIEQCTCVDWSLTEVESKLNARMTNYYSDGEHFLDAVLVPSDYFSGPVSTLLKDYGYGTEERPMALITGNDAYESVCQLIANDLVYMTVLKDTTLLSGACMEIIEALNNGTEVPGLTDYQPDDNYDITLDAYFVEMYAVTKANLRELVVDSGFYSEDVVFGELEE